MISELIDTNKPSSSNHYALHNVTDEVIDHDLGGKSSHVIQEIKANQLNNKDNR